MQLTKKPKKKVVVGGGKLLMLVVIALNLNETRKLHWKIL